VDQPTYTPVQQIVERSDLERYAGGIIEKKKAAMGPGCPLLPEPAAAPTA
jgi:hypothetical protein